MSVAVAEDQLGPVGAPVDEVWAFPEIDTRDNQILSFFGRKGSGKSQLARELFRHWVTADRLVIDVTGDANPGSPRRADQPRDWADDLGTVTLRSLPKPDADGRVMLPPRPKGPQGKPVPGVWRYIPDPMSKTFADDLDRGVGLALFPKDRHTLVWIDEVGRVMPANATGPYSRTLIEQSRHFNCSALFCGPRPVDINVLVLAQSDRVFMFDVPGVSDRKRLSDTLGWPHRDLVDALEVVKTLPYHYLMYVASEHELYLCPPVEIT